MKYYYQGENTAETYFSFYEDMKKTFDDVNVMTFHKSSGGAFFVITGKKYFFRNKSTTGIVVALDVSEVEIVAELKALAGGSGLLDIAWGSISSLEEMVQHMLLNHQFTKE